MSEFRAIADSLRRLVREGGRVVRLFGRHCAMAVGVRLPRRRSGVSGLDDALLDRLMSESAERAAGVVARLGLEWCDCWSVHSAFVLVSGGGSDADGSSSDAFGTPDGGRAGEGGLIVGVCECPDGVGWEARIGR